MSTPAFRLHTTEALTAEQAERNVFDSPFLRSLVEEWVRMQEQPSSELTIRKWARTEPALDELKTPADVVDTIDSSGHDRADTILAALVRLTQTGQQMAGRIALQAMLPKLIKDAARVHPIEGDTSGREENLQVAIATFWTTLAEYPIHRRNTKVAANLAWDTLHQLTGRRVKHARQHSQPDLPMDPQALAAIYDDRDVVAAPAIDALDPTCGLPELLEWAVRAGTITAQDQQLLGSIYADTGRKQHSAVIANQIGSTPDAVRQRCHRVRRRLQKAVQQELTYAAA